MEFIGRQIDFGVGVEAVRGTAEATPDRNVRKVTCNIIPRSERVIDDTTFGRLEDAERVRTVRRWSEGDVEGIAHADVIGYFFYNLLGDITSEADGVAYKHALTLDQTITHDTLTLFVKDSDVRQEKLANGVITTLELSASTDNYVRYTANFLAKEGVEDTSTYPDLATEYDFVSRDISVKVASSEAGLASATALKLTDLSINFNSNAEARFVFGDYSPDNIYNKQFAIEGSFTKAFADEEFLDNYKEDDFVYMEIMIDGEADLGSGKTPYIKVLLNKVQITDWNRDSAGDDIVNEEVSFKAFYNTEDEQMVEVELRNTTEAYEIGS